MSLVPTDLVLASEQERQESIAKYVTDKAWQDLSSRWLHRAFAQRFMYKFRWLGRPIIQTPIDIVAMQEPIWQIKPDLIIETGIGHGGSLILSASMLALLDMCNAIEGGSRREYCASRYRAAKSTSAPTTAPPSRRIPWHRAFR